MDTKSIVRDFLEGTWNYEKRMALCDVLAPDYVMHGPTGDVAGCRAFQQSIAAELENVGDMLVKVEDLIAEGDRVVARCTTTFELHGEFMGAYPPGHTITMQSVSIHRVANGKVAESWETYDRRCLLRDLGASQGLREEDRFAIASAVHDVAYSDSAEVVSANGDVLRGRRQIAEWQATFPPGAEWKVFDVEIDGAGEMACVRGSYVVSVPSRAKVPFDKGKYLEVWRKGASSWKVVRRMLNSEMTARVRAPLAMHPRSAVV